MTELEEMCYNFVTIHVSAWMSGIVKTSRSMIEVKQRLARLYKDGEPL